jgi:hypothetical protein
LNFTDIIKNESVGGIGKAAKIKNNKAAYPFK